DDGMQVVIGADHRGVGLKHQVAQWLRSQGYEVNDVGAEKLDPYDDYPEYAVRVARMVSGEKEARGIVLCGSGVGVCIAANKIEGVRCGQAINIDQVISARKDDDIGVLALAADHISFEAAREIVKVFLETEFSGEERHVRRVEQVVALERNGISDPESSS